MLFLDELSSGLDLESRLAVWKLVRDLRADGSTILLATHDLNEASQLSDTIAVIGAGRIQATGTLAQLKKALGEPSLEGVFARLTRDMDAAWRAAGTVSTGIVPMEMEMEMAQLERPEAEVTHS